MEWSDIAVFLAVARAGQMAGASRTLGLDHSTISRRVSRFEAELKVSLFERAGRRLRLTLEGEKLLATAEKLESLIIRDVLSLGDRRDEVSGHVRIGATEGFGAHYLASRLPRIFDAYPALEIELVALPRTFSLGMREVDIAIVMDRPEVGDIRFRKLCDYTLGIYAHADYVAKHGLPSTPEDLRDQRWCGYIDELLYTKELDILHFGTTEPKPVYRTANVTVQLEAVKGGAVLGLLPCYMGEPHPELVRLMPDQVALERSYFLSVHGDLADSPRVRAVMTEIEHLVHEDRALFHSG